MLKITLLFTIGLSLMYGQPTTIRMNQYQEEKLATSLRTAVADSDPQSVLRQSRRYLELFPNDPKMQAPVYLLMSEAYKQLGDPEQQAMFSTIANRIQPGLNGESGPVSGPATRGDKANRMDTIMTAVGQGLQAYTQIRMQIQQQKLIAQQAQMQQQLAAQQQQIGQPVLQQRQVPVQYAPQAQPTGVYQPAPIVDPNYNPNTAANGPMPGWAPQANLAVPVQQEGGPFSPPAQYAAAVASPYSAPATYAAPAPLRGAKKALALNVIHDHSKLGSAAYFEQSCGMLLSAAEAALTIFPKGGEAPLVIPASEIVEIRINSIVGREQGAFHFVTKRGLYVQMMPASASNEETREMVAALREALHLAE